MSLIAVQPPLPLHPQLPSRQMPCREELVVSSLWQISEKVATRAQSTAAPSCLVSFCTALQDREALIKVCLEYLAACRHLRTLQATTLPSGLPIRTLQRPLMLCLRPVCHNTLGELPSCSKRP